MIVFIERIVKVALDESSISPNLARETTYVHGGRLDSSSRWVFYSNKATSFAKLNNEETYTKATGRPTHTKAGHIINSKLFSRIKLYVNEAELGGSAENRHLKHINLRQ